MNIYIYISFEPNKLYKEYYKNFKNHTLFINAAYIYDGIIKMNMDRNFGGFGSSIIMEKKIEISDSWIEIIQTKLNV